MTNKIKELANELVSEVYNIGYIKGHKDAVELCTSSISDIHNQFVKHDSSTKKLSKNKLGRPKKTPQHRMWETRRKKYGKSGLTKEGKQNIINAIKNR